MTTDKSAPMLPPTEAFFKQHVLRAKYQTRIWCDSHIPIFELVSHGWSACEDGCITQTMFTKPPAPVKVCDLTLSYCTDNGCSNGRKCPCLIAGLEFIDVCSYSEHEYTSCENKK